MPYINFNGYTTTQNGQFTQGLYEDEIFTNQGVQSPPPDEQTFGGYLYMDNTLGNYEFQSVGSNGQVDVFLVPSDPSIPISNTPSYTLYQTGFQTTGLISFTDVNNNNYVLATSKPTASLTNPSVLYNDGTGGSFVTDVACFAQGTEICTAMGAKVVEDLACGDLVATNRGVYRPIKWIGHRTIDCRRRRDLSEIAPIRIMAGAIAENVPCRDLTLSPGHSVCVDVIGGILIPISCLINGLSIC